MKKTVLITGASSGFGRLTAEKFHAEGWNVAASMRSPEKEEKFTRRSNLLVVELDVTKQASIDAAVAGTVDAFGAIDVLVNNAGYGGHALFEQFTDADIRAMYDTNVFGLMAVTRAVLPQMRKQQGGTIINVTSLAGVVAGPTTSVYSSTKFAVEGLTMGLAFELRPLNIAVKSVAPGSFSTNFGAATQNPVENGTVEVKAYAQRVFGQMAGVREQLLAADQNDPEDVADEIYDCTTTDTPIRNVVGADAEAMQARIDAVSHADFTELLADLMVPR